jgi:hypothetical protein
VTLRDLEGDRTYRVEVTAPGFVDWRNDVPLKRGQRVVVRAELTPTPSPPPPPVVTTSAGEPPPPPAPVPDAVALPLETFELEAGRHHVDLAQAGVNHVTLDPTETYRVWLGKGPTLGWGYYVLNPAGAQPGALGAKALEMKGATNLYLFRVGADTLGSGPDETKPRQLYLQNVRRKKSSTEVVAGSLEIPASSRVTVSGLDERLTYELLVSPGEPPARRREDGRAISSVVVGHPSDGLLVANLSAPLRLTRTTRFWLTLLDDEPAEGLEGRLSLTLRAVAAVQSHAPK